MKIEINQFMGELPILAPHLLPTTSASKTLNAIPEGGAIIPLKKTILSQYANPSNSVNSWCIYAFDENETITRKDDADFVRGPIANDAHKRMYIAGDGKNTANASEAEPKVVFTSPEGVKVERLGIGRPTTPTVSSTWETAQPSNPDHQVKRCAYYTTYITAIGEESEPSYTTQIINRWDGAAIPITLGAVTDPRAAFIRIYRSEGGAIFNFVDEVSTDTSVYTDEVASAELGFNCISENWNQPPTQLSSLLNIGNGALAGFYENTLCFSEPYYPHAWPIDYQLAFPDEIVSIALAAGMIIVVTKGEPWIVQGVHPSAMSQQSLDIRAPGLSRHAHVDMGEYTIYPSLDGLMIAGPDGMQNATQNILSRDQWLALQPDTFRAFRYQGKYLCFGAGGSFIFDSETGYYPISLTGEVLDGCYSFKDGKLYLLIANPNNTRSVFVFDSGVNEKMEWVSREFEINTSMTINSARIDADDDVDLEITGDDNYSLIATIADDSGFRLPSGRPKKIKVKVESESRVNRIILASTMGELV